MLMVETACLGGRGKPPHVPDWPPNMTERIEASPPSPTHLARDPRRLEFWPGKFGALDINALEASAVRVKGVSSPFPLRFLELYLNAEGGGTHWRFLPENTKPQGAAGE
jgi:hypothetical protein